jgi:hypothetical protein
MKDNKITELSDSQVFEIYGKLMIDFKNVLYNKNLIEEEISRRQATQGQIKEIDKDN